jgi:hypothetical protein
MSTELLEKIGNAHSRDAILGLQNKMGELIATGDATSIEDKLLLTHYFTDKDDKYGCGIYARELFVPKGALIVGKIHKRPHLNIVLKGKISVASEKGKHYFEAPCILPCKPGDKRVGYAEEDTIWVSIHMTEHLGEDKLEEVEDEVIAKSYEEFDAMKALECKGT